MNNTLFMILLCTLVLAAINNWYLLYMIKHKYPDVWRDNKLKYYPLTIKDQLGQLGQFKYHWS